MLEEVGGPGNRALSAATAALTICRGLVRLGATLLGLIFEQRGAERPVGPVIRPAGVSVPSHDRRSSSSTSILGKLTIWRHACTVTGQPVSCRLDAELSVPERCYSGLLLDWAAYGATAGAYRASQTMLGHRLELPRSVQAIETGVPEAATAVAAFAAQAVAAPATEPPGRLLVAQADGTGVPLVPAATGGTPARRAVRRGTGQPSGTKQEAILRHAQDHGGGHDRAGRAQPGRGGGAAAASRRGGRVSPTGQAADLATAREPGAPSEPLAPRNEGARRRR